MSDQRVLPKLNDVIWLLPIYHYWELDQCEPYAMRILSVITTASHTIWFYGYSEKDHSYQYESGEHYRWFFDKDKARAAQRALARIYELISSDESKQILLRSTQNEKTTN